MSSLVRGEWHVSGRLTLIYRLLGGPEIEQHVVTPRMLTSEKLNLTRAECRSKIVNIWRHSLTIDDIARFQCLCDPMCQKINMFINFPFVAFRKSYGIYRNMAFGYQTRKIGRLIKIRWTRQRSRCRRGLCGDWYIVINYLGYVIACCCTQNADVRLMSVLR